MRSLVLAAWFLSPGLTAQTAWDAWSGDFLGDQFGWSVDAAGDVNGDGHADLVVGIHEADWNGFGSGKVELRSGLDGQVLLEWFGDAQGDLFGWSVAGVGDVDGDSVPDVLAAAYLGAGTVYPQTGYARVFSGADGSLIHHLEGDFYDDWFGNAVAGLGDVDGDGRGDFAVGAPSADTNGPDAGLVRVFSGATGSILFDVEGTAPGEWMGFSVAGPGDIDGDGAADVLCGAQTTSLGGALSGTVALMSGATGTPLFLWHGDPGEYLGSSVAGAGDVNGDGVPDLIAGGRYGWGAVDFSGVARLWSGADGSLLLFLEGQAWGDEFGRSVAGLGDTDGDGLAEFAVSAPLDDLPGGNGGSVQVYRGGSLQLAFRFESLTEGDNFGWSVCGAGDLDGDGFDDLAIGAPLDNALGGGPSPGAGAVYTWRLLPEFSLALPTPGAVGTVNTLAVQGAAPFGAVNFVYGTQPGQTAVGPFCGGLFVDTANPEFIGSSTADALGLASVDRFVPSAASGAPLILQAVDLTACQVSNAVLYVFP